MIAENSYIVNSFHAIDGDTKEIIPAEDDGTIQLEANQKVIFEDAYNPGQYVHCNTLIFRASDGAFQVYLNDNTTYPFYVADGEQKGVQYMAVYSFTAVDDCTLYYEGLVA